MGYRCCALHDAADATIEALARIIQSDRLTDAERALWRARLFDAVDMAAFAIEKEDGSIHVRFV